MVRRHFDRPKTTRIDAINGDRSFSVLILKQVSCAIEHEWHDMGPIGRPTAPVHLAQPSTTSIKAVDSDGPFATLVVEKVIARVETEWLNDCPVWRGGASPNLICTLKRPVDVIYRSRPKSPRVLDIRIDPSEEAPWRHGLMKY